MLAADRVDSTTGVQMAYLKQWAPRAHNDLELRGPSCCRARDHGRAATRRRPSTTCARVDLMYLDPPYNQHRYFTNYHIWETLVRWDAPERTASRASGSTAATTHEERVQPQARDAGGAFRA